MILTLSFLFMLAMMVARTTSATGTTADSPTASAQPSLHEVKAMVSEAAKLHPDDDAVAQLGEMGPRDNYIISCEDSYIEAYMCWYYNNTHCYSGQLTSDAPECLKDCQCVKWTESYWGPGNDGEQKLPIDTPANNESSRV